MLLVLHGPAISASRSKLLSIKQKFDPSNVVTFEKESDPKVVMATLMTPGLLDAEQLIILENPSEDLDLGSSILNPQSSIIIWFDHEVAEKKPVMERVKRNGQVLYFPPEKELTIFPFLDLLADKSPKAYLELNNLQKTHEKFSDNQYLFTMVFYLLRSLVTTPRLAPSFVKQKLEKQRENFAAEELIDLYRFMLGTDYKIKTGLIDNTQAQFLLINKFISQNKHF